ncbi:MAG: hypothetical protein J7K54_01405 [Candidatus Aenigmarchaeota archaeon]|nr:hypothetical protein [Candidatus Aenigmarchaeota archaeon]
MDFRVLPIENRDLFLRYAVPCGDVLVRRGELQKELLDSMRNAVKEGSDVEFSIEDKFKVASRMCTILAKQMNKDRIDDEVIRRYFLVEHEKAILWRKQVKPDIDVEECKVYAGRITKLDDRFAFVKTPLGEVMLRTDFREGLKLKEGDWVSKHYGYIAEKLDSSLAAKIPGMKRV